MEGYNNQALEYNSGNKMTTTRRERHIGIARLKLISFDLGKDKNIKIEQNHQKSRKTVKI